MSQSVLLQAAGLHTFKNYYSSIPNGALEEALNLVIDRDNIIEPRRGLFQYSESFGLSIDRASQLLYYKNRPLVHYNSTLLFDSDGSGNLTAFAGAYESAAPGLRIRGVESNGNLYITTSDGVQVISASSTSSLGSATINISGVAKALDLVATADYSQSGFLLPLSTCAYKIVWGIVDNNENLKLGAPSSRYVLKNYSLSSSAVADLVFSIPDEIIDAYNAGNQNYFYQIYRTQVFEASTLDELELLDPGLEMFLVLEDFPDAAEILATEVQVVDQTPEDFRAGGTLLYTNPASGDGVLQSNDKPPFAKDISLYKNYLFYANTKTKHLLNLATLTISDLNTTTSSITITDGTNTNTYTFQGEVETVVADFTAYAGLVASLDGNYFTLVSANDERKYYIWFDSTGLSIDPLLPGYIGISVDTSSAATIADAVAAAVAAIENNSIDFNITVSGGGLIITSINANNGTVSTTLTETIGGGFTLTADGNGLGEDILNKKIFLPRIPGINEFGPSIAQQVDQMTRSLVRVVNGNTAEIVYAYYTSDAADVPGQFLLEAKSPTAAAFYIVADSATTGDNFNPPFPTSGTDTISTNEERPNRLFYSKLQQPEAVPLVNYIDIGPKDEEIKRIVALRDSLFIFKEDGVYRLSGDVAPNFFVSPFDSSTTLVAPDSAVVLNNTIFCLTVDGVAVVSDTGVQIISRPIEDLISKLIRPGYNTPTASFGVNYDSDKSYLLWTVTEKTDTVATQCFRFNFYTQAWTKWDVTATCGLVSLVKDINGVKELEDKLYIGAGDANFIEIERKNKDRTDYADRNFIRFITASGVSDNIISLSSALNISVGDVVTQTQYLTIEKYNQLLRQLDMDPTLSYLQAFTQLNVDASTDTFNITGHGFSDGQVVTAKRLNTLPLGLEENTFYFVINSTPNSFQLSLTSGGPSIDLADSGYSSNQLILSEFLYNNQAAPGVNLPSAMAALVAALNTADSTKQTYAFTAPDVDPILDEITITSHGFSSGEIVRFSGGGLPGGITANQKYYVISPTTNTFKISATSGGPAVDITSTGAGSVSSNYYYSGSTLELDIQDEFNDIIEQLNTSSGVFFANYNLSSGSVVYESTITEVDKIENNISIIKATPFVEGSVTIYKAIKSTVVWSPQFFQDPSLQKQVSEGTIIFEDNNFSFASLSYSSDLSPAFASVVFSGAGVGDWGQFSWSNQNWGGISAAKPLRTLIPTGKQRCRFMNVKFTHGSAFEKYAIYGLSLTFRPYSTRAYK